jgi:hypothetical protein
MNYTQHAFFDYIIVHNKSKECCSNCCTYHVNLCSIANSNNKNVTILPLRTGDADEIFSAPTEYTDPDLSSFTLMLEEPKSNHSIV